MAGPGRALASQLGTAKKIRKGIISGLGSAQRCHGLWWKKYTFCRQGSVFQVVMEKSFILQGVKICKAVKRGSFSENIAKMVFTETRNTLFRVFSSIHWSSINTQFGAMPPPPDDWLVICWRSRVPHHLLIISSYLLNDSSYLLTDSSLTHHYLFIASSMACPYLSIDYGYKVFIEGPGKSDRRFSPSSILLPLPDTSIENVVCVILEEIMRNHWRDD